MFVLESDERCGQSRLFHSRSTEDQATDLNGHHCTDDFVLNSKYLFLLLICSIAKSTLAGLAPVNPEFDPYTCRLADNSLKIA